MAKFPYENIKGMLYFSDWAEDISDYYQDAKYHGNTATFPGFYAPQGRQLRLKALDDRFLETLNDLGVSNFEMETSAIYGLSKLLGHKALTVNNVIANRRRGEFASDHHASEKQMIEWVLERIIPYNKKAVSKTETAFSVGVFLFSLSFQQHIFFFVKFLSLSFVTGGLVHPFQQSNHIHIVGIFGIPILCYGKCFLKSCPPCVHHFIRLICFSTVSQSFIFVDGFFIITHNQISKIHVGAGHLRIQFDGFFKSRFSVFFRCWIFALQNT